MAFHGNIFELTKNNTTFRTVLFTGAKTQLVVMDIKPGEDIGQEKHVHVEQALYILSGNGKVVLDGVERTISTGDVIIVTPDTVHNFVNTGSKSLKIFTTYSPPNHVDGTIHVTKRDAVLDLGDEAFGEQVK